MNLESEDGTLIPIEIGKTTVIGRNVGLGLGQSSFDWTISRRHVSLQIDSAVDNKLDDIDQDGQIVLKFKVIGKNPVLVCSKGGGGKRVCRNSAEGVLNAGDSFSPSIKNPIFFVVKRGEGKCGVEKSVMDAVERRERKTRQRRSEAEERAKSEAAGPAGAEETITADSGLKFDPLDISEIDPVKEFGFLVKGREFDRYHKRIRPFKDWNWFLEEPSVKNGDGADDGDDETVSFKYEAKWQKMNKGGEEDDKEWTGDSEDEKVVAVRPGSAKRPIYSTRSKDPKKQKSDAQSSKKLALQKKVKFQQNKVVDDEDETLGGFIVCDDDIEAENFDEESEEEEVDEDDDEDSDVY